MNANARVFILNSLAMNDPQRSPTLLWFRDDLRLSDNAALKWAADHGPVIGLFIDETINRSIGAAARWWREQSLNALAQDLSFYGVPLLRRTGNPLEILPKIVSEMEVKAVTWNRRYHQPLCEVDATLKKNLRDQGIEVHSHPGFLLTEPWEVSTATGTPYKVFTPFSKAAWEVARVHAYETVKNNVPVPSHLTGPEDVELPIPEMEQPFWATTLVKECAPGEKNASEKLFDFLEHLQDYPQARDSLARSATSKLSAHLRFGEISIHRVWAETAAIDSEGTELFLKELLWRDFAWHRLYALPHMDTQNVRMQFDRFGWSWDPSEKDKLNTPSTPLIPTKADQFHEDLAAWRAGKTGIPLVDAGMRELWATGSMHNRVRMVVASFLTKNLQIHWRHGEEWFWETLVDADPASNAFNWQWAAGSGDDASPYFRIFNPVTQAKKFDPDETYIRRWVPEYGTPSYPDPIVDLKESRQIALDAYSAIK